MFEWIFKTNQINWKLVYALKFKKTRLNTF